MGKPVFNWYVHARFSSLLNLLCLNKYKPLDVDPSTQSEDCLTVSIYRPAGVKPSAKLPVVSHDPSSVSIDRTERAPVSYYGRES